MPTSEAANEVIAGAVCSPQVPASTLVAVDAGDDRSALCKFAPALTCRLSTPTRVELASPGVATIVSVSEVAEAHVPVTSPASGLETLSREPNR